ncbi:hypothetical protein KSP40_PGU004764 [Platanthera guangdongensis]|uniref:Ubiquinone biosynthesis monooxygenase COQ6, mitochondrial n=1 Tax=Platanthera guangdongensis TaxID=2320717 RepID=A0ABR2LPX7_9ASPA
MRLAKELNIAILDSNPALKLTVHFNKDGVPHPRVSTVTPATISFFKEVGAWEYVEKQRHAYFNQMQVWDYSGLGYTRYHSRDVGKDYLGCVVENKLLCDSLLSRLQNLDFKKTIHTCRLISMEFPSQGDPTTTDTEQAHMMSGSPGVVPSGNTVEQIRHGSSIKLVLSDGSSLFAKLVVGADGAKSLVREMAGLTTTSWNYPQNAVICTVEHSVENNCAWQRFLPSGPIALLPIGDKFSNIVWTMSPEEASIHKSMSRDDFVKAVNYALDYGYGSHPQSKFINGFMHRISSISGQNMASMEEHFQLPPKVTDLVSERMTFPLSLRHAREYVSKRVVLIGDAAHAVHPLAGQGVNLGFSDAAALAKVIDQGLLVGYDIGEVSLLKKYEKERKIANMTMMGILELFQKAYSVDLGPLNVLRAAAFHGAQFIAPLKRNIVSYAMGDQKWPLFT